MSREPSVKARQILAAARDLFVADGFGATNVDAIAIAAGVSKATIYAHYANKEALFADIVRRECVHIATRMAVDDYDPAVPLAQSLSDFGARFVSALASERVGGLARMVVAESRRFPEIGRIFYDSAPGVMRERLAVCLRAAQASGTMIECDALAAADQLLGMLRGDLFFRLLLGEDPSEIDTLAHVGSAVATFCARYARTMTDQRDRPPSA